MKPRRRSTHGSSSRKSLRRPEVIPKAFTATTSGRMAKLVCPVGINPVGIREEDAELKNTEALWDTGATNSAISLSLVQKLKLLPTGMANVTGVHGTKLVHTYLVSLWLPNRIVYPTVTVTEGDIGDHDALIGMDIIGTGDFALSYHDGKSCFSFRYPSAGLLDFVNPAAMKWGIRPRPKPNDPCHCGSGTKYKKCCQHKDRLADAKAG